MKITLVLLILSFQTILFAKDTSLQTIKLQLQWKYQFQFAGFIMAKELGYYEDVGLDVELIEYNNSVMMQDLEEKKIDYAITNSIISYENKKLRDVTLVATYFQKSPLILITQKDIKSVMDLKNKKIMIAQDNITNSSLGILFEYFDINPQNNTFLPPSFNINDFIQKKVDVITGFRSNELYILDNLNIPYNIIDPIEHGFSTNAINLFVSHDRIQNKAQEIDDFLSATKKAWEYSLSHIEEVAKLIHNKYQPNKSVEHLIYEGKVTKELMLRNLYDIGEINQNFVMKTYKTLIKNNQLNKYEKSDRLLLKRENLQLWINEQYIQRTEYSFAFLIAGFFSLILLLILFWSFKMKKEIKRRVKAEIALKHQAQHDALTNLPNRYLFLDRLTQSMRQAKRFKKKIAVLYIDLDHFKEINDSLGHNVGDILLQEVALRLKKSVRETDTVARLGGDEFIIILNNFTIIETILPILKSIMSTLSKQFFIENQAMYITLSLGVAIYPDDSIDADTLIKNADAAMYNAKDSGRNKYQFYTLDMTDKAFQRLTLETQLRQSLEQNQMKVYYQLQMDARTNTITGMEALVRWEHPTKGLIPPDQFLALSEEIGFIVDIDRWVMKEAMEQFKRWHKAGLNPGVLSLNLSMLRLEKDGFIQEIKEILNDDDYIQDCFSFEITETQIMRNPEQSIRKLNELSALGISFSVDDFGTGHSSLSYLKKLPISKLKIDRSFVMDIPHDNDDKEITKTIIAMAKNLNLDVIAEGVETQEQCDFLLANKCNDIQGYFYNKPSPANEIEKKLYEKAV